MEEAKQRLLDLLEKVAEEQEYFGHTVDVTEISSGGSNLTAALYSATIHAEGKPDLKLFAKVALMDERARKISPMKDPFLTELYFYKKLQNEYEKIQEKYGVSEEHKVHFPKLYGSLDEYLNEILVLDNLIALGFKDFVRTKSADLEYVTTAIDLMAKFHALSLAFHHNDPEGFRQATEILAFDTSKRNARFEIMRTKVVANALKTVNDEHREKLEKFFNQEPDPLLQMEEMFVPNNTNTILHGDFKPSNLMHRRTNGKLEIIPVDFQLIIDGNPIRDLMYFIITATDEAFCRAHYHEMLDLYHDRLRVALSRFQIDVEDVYPESTYRAHLKEKSMWALILALTLLPMVLAEEGRMPCFSQDLEATDFLVEGGTLYKKRLNGLINNYVEWGLL